MWTDNFYPSINSPSSSSLAPSATAILPYAGPSNKLSTNSIIGAIVGSLLGGSLLLVGGFFLYKWIENNRNNQSQEVVMQIPGSESYYNQTERNIHNYG